MQRPIAQVERSSAAAVRAVFASCQVRHPPFTSLRSVATEPDLESALTLYRKKVESEFVAYVEEPDQWDLAGETASANADLPIFETSVLISISGTVEHLYQPFPLHAFAWWSATPPSSLFSRRLDWSLGSTYWHEYSHFLLYRVCPAEVAVWTSTPQSDLLEDLYHIEDTAAVAEFLARNEFLHDLLVEAHNRIVEFFGEDADVHLEVCDDADSGGDRQLYAVISTPLAAKDAIPIQERFDDEWWLDNLMRACGKFNIIVEYV